MHKATTKILSDLPHRISHVIRRNVMERPGHAALADGATTWSYADLSTIVADVALRLTAYGVRPGDRVLIVSENSLPLCTLVLAASEIDAWAVVVNPRLSSREIDQIRDHSGARRVFYVTSVADAGRDHADRHEAVDETIGALGVLAVGPLRQDAIPEPVEVDGARQVAILMYTSGTTGHPKGVMLTHRNLLFNAVVGGRIRGLAPGDRIYGVLPMSHIVGISSVWSSAYRYSTDMASRNVRRGLPVLGRRPPRTIPASAAHCRAWSYWWSVRTGRLSPRVRSGSCMCAAPVSCAAITGRRS